MAAIGGLGLKIQPVIFCLAAIYQFIIQQVFDEPVAKR